MCIREVWLTKKLNKQVKKNIKSVGQMLNHACVLCAIQKKEEKGTNIQTAKHI